MNGDFPESVWIMFQMTFAIITPALIVGAFVERIKFTAVMLFSGLWLIVVYCPVCYFACGFLKEKLGVDDSLDVAAVHGVGGILGTLMVSYLGQTGVLGGQGISQNEDGAYLTWKEQFAVQAEGCLAAIALSVVATFIIVNRIRSHRRNPSFRRR